MAVNGKLTAVALALAVALAAPAVCAGPTAAEIATNAFQVNGGDDTISRLTFAFQQPDGSERRLIYTMAWKHYVTGPVSDKAIFFNEFPPDDSGKSYMIWLSADRSRQDDEWMYLPELRMVRKITHDQSHLHKDQEDDFAHSLLTQVNLVPRNSDLDCHRLLGEEPVNGHADYVIESVPKEPSSGYPYQKTRRWITKDNFLTERIDYYNEQGVFKLSQKITWQRVGDAWVWEQVVGSRPDAGGRTVLDVSGVKVNNHLADELFSARTMRLGKDSLE